jgi:hypothetical protein
MSLPQPDESASPKVVSPFAQMEATVPRKPSHGSNIVLVGVLVIGVLVALGAGGFFLSRYMHDP